MITTPQLPVSKYIHIYICCKFTRKPVLQLQPLISVILKRQQREMAFCSSDPVYKEDLRSKIFLVLVKPIAEKELGILSEFVQTRSAYLEMILYNAALNVFY
jgi:hypothetical protein